MANQLPTESTDGRSPSVSTPPPWLGGMPGPAPEEEKGVDWRRYLAAAFRYKWLIIAVTIVGTAIGAFVTRYLKPVYLAQAAVWIQAGGQQRSGGTSGPIQSAQLLRSFAWVDLLKSFEVLDQVVRELRLYVRPSRLVDAGIVRDFGLGERFRPGVYRLNVADDGRGFVLLSEDGLVMQQGAPGDSIGLELGFLWAPPAQALRPGREVVFTVVTPRDAARDLRDRLETLIDRDGNFLRLELQGPDAEGIAAILNATVDRYVQVAADLKRQQLTERTRILREQLGVAQQNLDAAEQALEDFRIRTITLPSEPGTPVIPGLQETRGPVFDNFFAMQIERDALQRDRLAIERVIAAAESGGGLSIDALIVIGSVAQSDELDAAMAELTDKQAELRGLRYSYTEDHPQVVRLAADVAQLEARTIPGIGRALLGELASRVEALDQRIASASQELQEIPTRAIIEGRLRRDVAIADALYSDLQARFGESDLAERSSFPDVSVLDRAVVPQSPLTNNKIRVVLLAFAASIGLGIGGALLLDRLDRRVRYPEQVSEELGLSILGAITHVRSSGRLAAHHHSQLIEALRGIRLGLTHAYGAAGPLVVTVTSPGPGDGKSFVARHLATAYAEAGHRTLLVDGDIRRGELHRGVGASRKPGLTDYLKGSVAREGLVQNTLVAGLHFVGAGTRMADGPELLGSPAMTQLLLGVRAGFGVIVVDSPPLSAGVDPFVLGAATGAVLLVMRTGVTDRALAGAKLEMLARLPIRVLGAVLNDVRPNGQYRYYAYQYYAEGYEARDEVAAVQSGAAASLPRGG